MTFLDRHGNSVSVSLFSEWDSTVYSAPVLAVDSEQ